MLVVLRVANSHPEKVAYKQRLFSIYILYTWYVMSSLDLFLITGRLIRLPGLLMTALKGNLVTSAGQDLDGPT